MALQWLIVIAGDPPGGFEPSRLDAANPNHEVAHDVGWALPEVLPGAGRNDHDSDHLFRVARTQPPSTRLVDADRQCLLDADASEDCRRQQPPVIGENVCAI
jgi:hypothetical protein